MATNLDAIAEEIRTGLETKNTARDQALARSRELIRLCARSIRAAHRGEFGSSRHLLEQAQVVVRQLTENLQLFPDLYYAGYTQDALKEYAEAGITLGLIEKQDLPDPAAVGVGGTSYLRGLAEAAGEMRRHALDTMRRGDLQRAETILQWMDEIYGVLVTIDYPDALTGGLRRTTDMVRGVLERTRGDLTMAARQDALRQSLRQFEARLSDPRGASLDECQADDES